MVSSLPGLKVVRNHRSIPLSVPITVVPIPVLLLSLEGASLCLLVLPLGGERTDGPGKLVVIREGVPGIEDEGVPLLLLLIILLMISLISSLSLMREGVCARPGAW